MNHPLQARAKDLFMRCLELSASDRQAFVEQQSAGDEALRREVEKLLEAQSGSPLLQTATRHAILGAIAAEQESADMTSDETDRLVGTRVGAYKLLEMIGEGGFGAVYVAEQEKPVRRRVALKVIKLGMDTRQVIARFEAERQALAMMDHPNIARVLDAGATDTGRPWFAMELVRGVPITQYCDAANLSAAERLTLFIDVCHAVQHAHQKGVIHRDLKPSNVLVTLHDGKPVAKVIDFGIAKAVGAQLTDKTVYTLHRQMIGTPAYMAPEQAEMSGLDVDTRADVYSLGVLLYELLTGSPPFTAAELNRAGWAEMQRIIREVEPLKPSTRVNTLGESLPTVAARRRVEPRRLSLLLRGDLDWISMKALDKDRSRRYETANALAADVQRHLSGEPVIAAPPSATYRLRKFLRKHRRQALTVSILALTLMTGTFATTLGWKKAIAERDRADRERNEAKKLLMGLSAVLGKGSRFEGSLTSKELHFIYLSLEPDHDEYPGAVSFQLSADGQSFTGTWSLNDGSGKGQCSGTLLIPSSLNQIDGIWELNWTTTDSRFDQDRRVMLDSKSESYAWVFTEGDKFHGYYELDHSLLDVLAIDSDADNPPAGVAKARNDAAVYVNQLWAGSVPIEELKQHVWSDSSLSLSTRLAARRLLRERMDLDFKRAKEILSSLQSKYECPATMRRAAESMEMSPRVRSVLFGRLSTLKIDPMKLWGLLISPSAAPDSYADLLGSAQDNFNFSPNKANALTLGAAQYRAGKFDLAVESLTNANSDDTTQRNPFLDVFLAMTHVKLGRTEEARKIVLESSRGWDHLIEGEMDGRTLKFRFPQTDHGLGMLELSKDGRSFTGRWSPDGNLWVDWTGQRQRGESIEKFDGVWNSNDGPRPQGDFDLWMFSDGKIVWGCYRLEGVFAEAATLIEVRPPTPAPVSQPAATQPAASKPTAASQPAHHP